MDGEDHKPASEMTAGSASESSLSPATRADSEPLHVATVKSEVSPSNGNGANIQVQQNDADSVRTQSSPVSSKPGTDEKVHMTLAETMTTCRQSDASAVANNRLNSDQDHKQQQRQSIVAAADATTSPTAQSQTPPQQLGTTPAGEEARIPENILSPPKSETHTDETNTASSSPASDTQMSPMPEEPALKPSTPTTPGTPSTPSTPPPKVHHINVVANGMIPNSGKPLMSAMNKKLNKSPRSMRQRKPKTLVAMYESEISDNKTGIKLCIKKSDTSGHGFPASAISAAATAISATIGAAKRVVAPALTITSQASNAAEVSASYSPIVVPATSSGGKSNRKRSRKAKTRPRIDSDDSEYETKRKKERPPNSASERPKKVSFSGVAKEEPEIIIEQSDWGMRLPDEVLLQIFDLITENEGCLPSLFRLGRVCSLWRRVSLTPSLWKSLDLSKWVKEKYRTELKLKWFIDYRCRGCTELNVANWKVSDINCFLAKLEQGCPNLKAITLSGWKNFTSDHLSFLVKNLKKLERLDLSSINVEMNASKSAVGVQSLCNSLQTLNARLTHLYLAHNRLAGIPQIVNILSTHCPNLVLLDLSNVTTQATSHGILHVEKLQQGCPKLRVLRITNSHVTLSTAPMQEMMDSPGFPALEELSIAALTAESRIFGDEHLQRILKSSSKLKLLDVRGCTRLTHESLIRLPAWDIKHLFLSGCSVTRDMGSGLELIASKWAHSLIELDLAWANVQQPLDNALRALAEKGEDSPLSHLNLCGSSVSEEAVKDILANCAYMSSINLSSCRGLPRGVKRLMQGPQELQELRDVLKVQMKVKLPAERMRSAETIKEESATKDEVTDTDTIDDTQTMDTTADEGGGGGGESGVDGGDDDDQDVGAAAAADDDGQ